MIALVLALATGIVRAAMHSEPTTVGASLCPVTMKAKAVSTNSLCTTDSCSLTRYIPANGCTQDGTAPTADVSQCCEADTTKCGQTSNPCTVATHFQDPAKAGDAAGSDAATNCCTARGTCPASGFCEAGYKAKTTPSSKCVGATCVYRSSVNSCGSSTLIDAAACCEADTTMCGGLSSNPCTVATHFRDPTKADATAGSDATAKKANCCTAKASCSNFVKGGTASGASKSETMLALTLGMFAVAALLS